MTRKGPWTLTLVAAFAAGAVGCADSASEATITGAVTLDGAPLKSGQIRFVPTDGQSPSGGAVIADGRYSATLAPGEKQVEIRAAAEGPPRPMYGAAPATPPANAGGELIPPRYNDKTELKVQIGAEDAVHDFPLESK